MSTGFEQHDKCLVTISDKVTTTDPWGLSKTEFRPRFMTLAEAEARDINQKAGKPIITITGTTEVPQGRK
jgi:hypothetical protein